MLTENVSAHGARVFMERKLQLGQQVLVGSPKEGVRSQARIVYCKGGTVAKLTSCKATVLTPAKESDNPDLTLPSFFLARPKSLISTAPVTFRDSTGGSFFFWGMTSRDT